MAAQADREGQEPHYEPPRVTVHGTMASVTAAAHPGPRMDHHFPMNGQPGPSH